MVEDGARSSHEYLAAEHSSDNIQHTPCSLMPLMASISSGCGWRFGP